MARLGQCYILKLRSGKWYVGYTERGIDRILDHMDKKGAKWTKKYRPVKPIPWSQTPPGQTEATKKNKPNSDEDKLTLKEMKKHGIENVRGGSWCMVVMKQKTTRELELLIAKTKTKTPVMKKMFCNKCGRESHNRPDCVARNTVDGVKITTASWKYRPKTILKSSRKAKAQRCQAKTQEGFGPRCKLNAPPGSKFCGHHRR
jgi:predicted GIY-YIG superfamily endonuclease